MMRLKPLLATVLTASVVLAAPVALAQAQAWPAKPVRWIVPYPPGGGTDALARVLGEYIGHALGQPFVVDNKPGAATIIGADALAKSVPDGYTMMSADNATLVNNAAIYKKLPYDPVADLSPVTLIGRFPLVLVVNPSTGIHDFAEFKSKVKASPAEYHYATSGAGTPFHIGMEFIKQEAQLSIDHVPYKGMGPALADVMGGQVQVLLADVATVLPHIKSGKLVAIASASGQRNVNLPDVPTFLELGLKDSEFYAWQGVVMPAGTPTDIRLKLGGALKAAESDERTLAKMKELGIEPLSSTPEEMTAFWQSEMKRWQKIIKDRGITLD